MLSYYDFRLRWDDGRLRESMIREYSMVTAPDFEWLAPWDERPLRPARDVFDFTVNDEVIEYIERAGLTPRAHPLLHPSWNLRGDANHPPWLTQGNWTRDEAIAILREHILTVVGRYKGRVRAWAVVNEPTDHKGLVDCFWLRTIGPEYIEMAFRWAHEADPDAYLYLNDDGGEGLNIRSDKLYELAKTLVQKGVPIHGVGLETHVDLQYRSLGGDLVQTPADVRANMERLGALGLKVEITEMDVRIPIPATSSDLTAQARIFGEMLDACLSVPACIGFTTWGHTDRYSWIPRAFPGLGAALPFDEEINPKPAYFALHDHLARASGSVDVAPNYQGLWWSAPAGSEAGWGINFAHQGDIIFATWFTYGLDGKPLWLAMVADKTASRVYKGDIFTTTGPASGAFPFDSTLVRETTVGTGTISFTDTKHGIFNYALKLPAPANVVVTQTKSILLQEFATPVPTCTWNGGTDQAAATNYQDLWWNAPSGSEAGWGINLTHQGNTIFATWFTYDAAGKPLWLAFVANNTGPGVYSGDVFTTTGPAFNAAPFQSAQVTESIVGDATLSFSDGRNATFSYTVNGVARTKVLTRQVFAPPGTVCTSSPISDVTLYLNATSPMLLSFVRSDLSSVITVFGDRDSSGSATAADALLIESNDGNRVYIALDEQGKPVRVIFPDGAQLIFTWLTNAKASVKAIGIGGAEAVTELNLPRPTPSARATQRSKRGTLPDRRRLASFSPAPRAFKDLVPGAHAFIKVTNSIGQSVSDAAVWIEVQPHGAVTSFGSPRYAQEVSPPGNYVATFVNFGTDVLKPSQFQAFCKGVAEGTEAACDVLGPVSDVMKVACLYVLLVAPQCAIIFERIGQICEYGCREESCAIGWLLQSACSLALPHVARGV